ncbi:MAG: DUF3536 domain-containing protein [Deltaproteobacteria bacterium]|jgi:alpha-amylase/alpha-mannosidase (GH57 family)|nr:DUF3536 domain-containing protein [Deltaproteobacteria bacterium]
MSSPRYLVVHGHFYQPPRENPFSGSVGDQPSAAPFANWNVRVARECYTPNAMARVLGDDGLIRRIVNNYSHMSFNMGPTLLSWMETEIPGTRELIVEADRAGARDHEGHGPAMAQVFNHVIMPLANFRDKLTQVVWGRDHFVGTFGRAPEGMWLAETAADTESLALLAKAGVKFTVLAQSQVDASRPLTPDRSAPWEPDRHPDPREPYRIFWGRGPDDYLDAFVYDGPVSRAVAFESLLRDGRSFLDRIARAFGDPDPDGGPRLVNLATDGESYGHHFQFGEMALAWLVDELQGRPADDPDRIVLTNYGHYLAMNPPRREARLVENSSWSCAHGVERWRSDCGCSTGGGPGWNQRWRTPLRDGLNYLRDKLAAVFERTLAGLVGDPWAARNDYLRVLASQYDPGEQNDFLAAHRARPLAENEKRVVLTQMEAQLMSLYMFTSCGWFFDDLAGLEPVQNLRYAHRAIALAGASCDQDLTAGLLAFLRQAVPNRREFPTGEDVWREMVEPQGLPAPLSAAHWSAARLMGVPESLGEFRYQKFAGRDVLEDDLGDGRVLAGLVEITDPRDRSKHSEFCLAGSAAGGESLSVVVLPAGAGGPAPDAARLLAAVKNDPGLLKTPAALLLEGGLDAAEGPAGGAAAYALDDLWTSARRSILSDLVADFFNDLRDYTEKSFSRRGDMLVKFARSRSSPDWLQRFVFRVVVESRIGSFLEVMRRGGRVDLPKLAELVADKDTAGSFQTEPALVQAGQEYLAALIVSARSPEARPTVLREALDFAAFLKKNNTLVDYWESQNKWRALAGDRDFRRSLDLEGRKNFLALGSALGFESRFDPDA